MSTKPCRTCGGTKRYKNGSCARCAGESRRKWEQKNREVQREYERKYRNANLEKAKASHRLWSKNNPEKTRIHGQMRRGRKANAGDGYTASEWKKLCAEYNNHCCFPGCESTDLHADHVVPLSRGGAHDISNIQPLCAHHNHSKGTKTADYRHKVTAFRWIQKKLFG